MKRYMTLANWSRNPRTKAKRLPAYVPENIQDAYYQACAISSISPEASSTISRYCLQMMVRGFWNIPESQRGTLDAEIDLVSAKMPPETIESIAIATNFGNIAHAMTVDARRMVATRPEEAEVLIHLLETLFDDWYADREQRQRRTDALRRAVEQGQTHAAPAIPALDSVSAGSYMRQIEAQRAAEPGVVELDQSAAEVEPATAELPNVAEFPSNSVAREKKTAQGSHPSDDTPSIAEIVRRI